MKKEFRIKRIIRNGFYAMLCTVFLTACTSESDFQKVKKQLENQGYTNIKNTGYDLFCCSDDDTFSTGFTAIDKDGKKVDGCVCSGILKGSTVRFK